MPYSRVSEYTLTLKGFCHGQNVQMQDAANYAPGYNTIVAAKSLPFHLHKHCHPSRHTQCCLLHSGEMFWTKPHHPAYEKEDADPITDIPKSDSDIPVIYLFPNSILQQIAAFLHLFSCIFLNLQIYHQLFLKPYHLMHQPRQISDYLHHKPVR